MMKNDLYTQSDLQFYFDPKDYERGRIYSIQGKVTTLHFDHEQRKITSSVRGSYGNFYIVNIYIKSPQDTPLFQGNCSCPLQSGCKHMVATLLEGINRGLASDPETKPLEHQDVTVPIASSESNISFQTNNTPQIIDHPVSITVHSWLQNLTPKTSQAEEKKKKITIYLVESSPNDAAFMVSPVITSILKNGALSKARRSYRLDQLGYHYTDHMEESDSTILGLISSLVSPYERYKYSFNIPAGKAGQLLFNLLIESGRCYLSNAQFPHELLKWGKRRTATLSWKSDSTGAQKIQTHVEGLSFCNIIKLQPPYYICSDSKEVGVLETGLSDRQAMALLQAPPIPPENAIQISQKLASLLDIKDANLLPSIVPIEVLNVTPQPHLKLTQVHIKSWESYNAKPVPIAAASLSFNYADAKVNYGDSRQEIKKFHDGKLFIIQRDMIVEKGIYDDLAQFGLTLSLRAITNNYKITPSQADFLTIGQVRKNFYTHKKVLSMWSSFVKESIPLLRSQGWKVTIDSAFPFNIVEAEDEWYAEVSQKDGLDWFDVELGVMVEGKPLNLVPILISLLKKETNLFENIQDLSDDHPFLITIEDGRRLALPTKRLRLLINMIRQLFSFQNSSEDSKLKLSHYEGVVLAEMEAASKALNLRWFGDKKMLDVGKRLKEFKGLPHVAPTETFKGKLRPYQQDGLNWLQFLRDHNLSGILADDMGLGKTVQVLAHMTVEKASGRLIAPFLVIAPTSLMINWKAEAARFAPNLKVLVLYGPNRKQHFNNLHDYDVILTTYSLLLRDKKELIAYNYHTIILDEAQTIKNSRTQMTQIVNQLQSSHRLCMTGTPLENHLGELWSLFNFLMPGYLGQVQKFNTYFRSPIEKAGDRERSQMLARRIKPFILRRLKQDVVTELPLKTEIIHWIELEGAQRDLYETIRVSMQEKVRQEIVAHGAGKNHIIVLDALLKLRQVCCDPALLKVTPAKSVIQSAKLDELMSLIKRMVEEGRKILVFSQFTSMLAMIENQLDKLEIPYAILTGQTKDRETPIRLFQEGDVPIFLISLKAGGTGLNLTAADTVIHYDPWWNPAVENQATDRAYRIGQNKPVFVYRLITRGTVEEKIMELQEKKSRLMDNLFDHTAKSSSKLTLDDIQTLFEPFSLD